MSGIGNHMFDYELCNGVKIEGREVPGFGERSEVGIFIVGQMVGTFLVDKKRSNNIQVKPTMMRTINIKMGEAEEAPPPEKPTLGDVIVEDSQE